MRFVVFIILSAFSVKTIDCIVRGHNAMIDKCPYVVRIESKKPAQLLADDFYLCGAAVIDESWLLTAAHCFDEKVSVKVYLGSTSRGRAAKIYTVPFSNVVVHPDFDLKVPGNDIALIRIPRTALSRIIAVVPLPKKSRSTPRHGQDYAIACGWGKTSTNAPEFSQRLQWGRLQLLERKQCRHPVVKKKTRNIICTAVRPNLASICLGDSGGPLVSQKTGELVGIASLGDLKDCEHGYTPVFTQVASHLDWIKTVSGVAY